MGLFDIFKRKEQPQKNNDGKILLAMPMFVNGDRYNLDHIIENLKNYWKLNISSIDGNDDTAILTIDGNQVAIGYMPIAIPMSDIEGTAQYAYNWMSVLDDLKGFSGHCIVSIMAGKKTTVEKFKLLSKVLYSILSTSNSIGVYQGGQSLLISRDEYLDSAKELLSDGLPINLWVYIGLIKSTKGNSSYTYGLREFGKNEMEIVHSKLGLEDIYDFIANTCSYVIENNVTFKNGETLGFTADQKVKITLSKGQFVDGQSLKLDM